MTGKNCCDNGFDKLLKHFDWEYLETYKGSIMGLWPDMSLAFLNPSWFDFAQANAGEPAISARWNLGTCVLDAVSESLRAFCQQLFQDCLTGTKEKGSLPQHVYECSSAEVYRCFAMHLYPLDGEGALIMHAPIVEYSHPMGKCPSFEAVRELYLDNNQVIHQCSYCRRVKNESETNRWDWVPDWVNNSPPEVCHITCGACMDHYFPDPTKKTVLQDV